MDVWMWVVLIVVVAALVAVIVAAAAMMTRKRQSEQLQRDFGPEYDRALDEHGDRRQAESALKERRERVSKFRIRPLSADERSRFNNEWSDAQVRFVDDPAAAIGEADRLVQQVMRARGFPVADFEQNAADLSVEHPYVVEQYRAAHAISIKNDGGEADTEDLRQGMVHYRGLFAELANATGADDMPQPRREREDRSSREATHRPAGRLGNVQRRR